MNQDIAAQLEARGHEVDISSGAVCQSIQRKDGELHAVSDSRKGGVPDGYWILTENKLIHPKHLMFFF